MKFAKFVIIFSLLSGLICAQIPEWVEIDLQEFIMYDATTFSYFVDLDLTDQEIYDIYKGDYGALWFETQDYKIKFLPNNLIFYSKKTGEIPILFAPCSYNSINYYSRILNEEVAAKLPKNTWVKYFDPENYDYMIKKNEMKLVDEKYFKFYALENYSIPITSENEINQNEIASSLSDVFIEEWNVSDENRKVESLNKLFYRSTLRSNSESEKCFDILKDSNNNLWLATGKRLIRFDGKSFYEINIPALTLASDLQNNLWIGTSAYNTVGSLIKFDGFNFTYYNSLNSPLPDNDGILDIETDYQGNLWISLKRTGLPSNRDNIKLAVYNPSGVKISTESLLYSIHWIRKPFNENLKSIFTDQFYVRMNPETFKSYTKIELLLNNKVISTIDTKNEFPKDESLEITFFVDKTEKYSLIVYANDFNSNKIEIANYELNNQFNANGYFLGQNKPNPFSNFTRIEYGFYYGHQMELRILDSFMKQVATREEHYIDWIGKPFVFDAGNLPNGIYDYYLTENYSGIVDVKKMILFNPQKIITLPQKADKP
jgi:hypothetical protein